MRLTRQRFCRRAMPRSRQGPHAAIVRVFNARLWRACHRKSCYLMFTCVLNAPSRELSLPHVRNAYVFMLACVCRRGKIVASLGPATWQPEAMAALLAAGVDVVRFNVKHQSQVGGVGVDGWVGGPVTQKVQHLCTHHAVQKCNSGCV
jgi:hypothetical protein